jgi:hypothetical protein
MTDLSMPTSGPRLVADGGERDPQTGKFLPGHQRLGGKPRRRELWAIAAERAEAAGVDLEAEVFAVLKMQIDLAKGGDTAAAKLVLDHLCGRPSLAVEIENRGPTLEQLIMESHAPREAGQ